MAAQLSDDAPSKPHLVLTYLNIKGYAEPIRLTLAIGKIPFEDRRVSYEEVKRMRSAGELPFGQVPVMDIEGVRHGQSRALLRWAGTQSGLYPVVGRDDDGPMHMHMNMHLQLHIDAALDTITDIQTSLPPAWYGHACGRSPVTGDLYPATKLTEEQMVGVFEALNSEILPVRFQQLERMLAAWAVKSASASTGVGAGGGEGSYFCGDLLTIADVNAYVLISGMLDGTYLAGLDGERVLSGCPGLKRLVAAVAAHPRVQAWGETAAAAGQEGSK